METICQILIVVLGIPSIWLLSRLERWRRWGFVIGLVAQPVWFYVTIVNGQWGMCMLTTWYTYSWSMGIYNYFFKTEGVPPSVPGQVCSSVPTRLPKT